MILSPIINDRTHRLWCGPAALCAITGIPVSEANAALEEEFTKNDGGVCWESISRECSKRGFVFCLIDEKVPLLSIRKFSLVVLDDKGHYVVVHNGRLVDSGNQKPTLIKKTRFRNSITDYHFEIRRRASKSS